MKYKASDSPFGDITEDDIAKFETDNDIKLPTDYIVYLLQCNGGDFDCDVIEIDGRLDYSIEFLFSLYRGPQDTRLENIFEFSQYDLRKYQDKLSSYFVIGFASGGAFIILKLDSGGVYLYDPDHSEIKSLSELQKHLHFVAEDFYSFAARLRDDP